LVEKRVSQVIVRKGAFEVTFTTADARADRLMETISIAWSPTSATRERDLILPPGSDPATARPIKAENRVRLLKAIRETMTWLDELIEQRVADTEALARREACSERTVRLTLSLAFLSPDIVRAAIEGRLPRGLGALPA
jgi:site-specific DNA recombinase